MKYMCTFYTSQYRPKTKGDDFSHLAKLVNLSS